MKAFALAAVFCLICFWGNAMIIEVGLDELAQSADIVVVADVEAVKTVGSLDSGATVIANLVKVDEPIKGEVAVGEKLKIKTYGRIEDNAVLVEKTKVLLFLKKSEDHYLVHYGIQGCWPIDSKTGKLTGMGDGKTLEEVKDAVKKEPAPQRHYEPVSL
jgi:hypothetical protein